MIHNGFALLISGHFQEIFVNDEQTWMMMFQLTKSAHQAFSETGVSGVCVLLRAVRDQDFAKDLDHVSVKPMKQNYVWRHLFRKPWWNLQEAMGTVRGPILKPIDKFAIKTWRKICLGNSEAFKCFLLWPRFHRKMRFYKNLGVFGIPDFISKFSSKIQIALCFSKLEENNFSSSVICKKLKFVINFYQFQANFWPILTNLLIQPNFWKKLTYNFVFMIIKIVITISIHSINYIKSMAFKTVEKIKYLISCDQSLAVFISHLARFPI